MGKQIYRFLFSAGCFDHRTIAFIEIVLFVGANRVAGLIFVEQCNKIFVQLMHNFEVSA